MKFHRAFLCAVACSCALYATDTSAEIDEFDAEYSQKEVFDPLSGYNRVMTGFNDVFYRYLVTPVATGYDYVMPDPIQGAFANFFHNLMYPMRLTNNLLQGKFENSWDETKRFLINTTIGFAGLSDAATLHFNIPRHDEDFGQTLGYWGVPAGPHIVWPILGSSNLRDTFGLVGDFFTNPINYIDDNTVSMSVNAFRIFNDYSRDPEFYEKMTSGAVDLYPFLRDAYEQSREQKIKE
ncbi:MULTISPECIES: MlaA family lipoprotein [unclassified Campylobacter]|uniref:MlaA family lipoprotein n=1 Tax=unclassified Campylobacter TaxID=2593542 RepID=UPI0022EA0B20|nr:MULTISPECIES: VacJ family lipoprotein [unclassified Campylobacter]MDA3054493.1 VacJ family lipoprotein [Campylobacter sp. VBCF_07 NA4]MDA3060722.1 VacJ family lipoprotein [Campylobacter sp. VBCF_02 NA5]MDA3070012.1 VacJ family lipoprotein [Campylobacter sp. VBCF_08 NA3]WBR54450.1 VacJ family lipoprotein [Campylobacter sp. VBCF_01 NA2]